MRKRRAVPAAEVFGADERMPEGDEDRSRELRLALADLPDEQRDVIVLRHVVGLTPDRDRRAGWARPSRPCTASITVAARALRTALVERGCARRP